MAELFISANEVAHDSFLTAANITLQDGKIPHVIYKLTRGGDNFGNAHSEIMKYSGLKNKLSEIIVGHYNEDNKTENNVRIYSYGLPPWLIRRGSLIGIDDDLPDTGETIKAVTEDIKDLQPYIKDGNIVIAVLMFKDLVNEPKNDVVEYQRFYQHGPLTRLHDYIKTKYPGKTIRKKSTYEKPDYWARYLKVEDKKNPKSWVDFGTHEIVGLTPEEIAARFGEDVLNAISHPNLDKIAEKYGNKFSETLDKNIQHRLKMENGKVTIMKVPGTQPLTLADALGITKKA